MRGAQAVGAGVASSNDDHVFACGVDRRVRQVAFLDPVGRCQVIHSLVDAFERDYLGNQLERSDRNIAQAARNSGMDRSYFKRLLKRHGLLGKKDEK